MPGFSGGRPDACCTLNTPLRSRTLFKMQANGTKGRRAILALFRAALLGTSMFGGRFPELLKELVKRFGS
jgi:hypothetical protein